MHVVVIGAGVIGVTTAYYLAELGCRVSVVDRAADVANGASFGNAGQLSYSFTDALANPGFIRHIPGIISGNDTAYRIVLDAGLIAWGLRFLAQCTDSKARENTVSVLKVAMRSEQLLKALQKRLQFDFSHRDAGKLVLLGNEAAVRDARARSELKKSFGCETEILNRDATVELEPAIAHMPVEFVGAVYSKNDCVADSKLFTTGMQRMLEESTDVQFHMGSEAKRIVTKGRRLRAIELAGGELSADAAVVCTGAWSHQLLKSVHVNPGIYPVRGYSVTLPPGDATPEKSITVLHKKTVFSRINGNLRIAGFADFRGFNEEHDVQRTDELLAVAREIAPRAADYEAERPLRWGGYRPMTPNGRPRVGPSKIDGLFLNTGHGMLGWTLACASSYDIASSVVASSSRH